MVIKILDKDYDSLEDLLKESFHKDVSKIDIKKCLDNNIRFLCALESDRVISNIMITTKYNPVRNTKSFYLDYICTKEDYRNKGIASILLLEVEKIARNEHINKIELDTSFERESAQKLYEKAGFIKRDAYLYLKEIDYENI